MASEPAKSAPAKNPLPEEPLAEAKSATTESAEPVEKETVRLSCRSCGHELEKEEFYCGICGTPRPSSQAGGGDLQSKWASMWHLKQASQIQKGDVEDEDEPAAIEAVPNFPPIAEIQEAEEVDADELEEAGTSVSKLSQPGMRILPAAAESTVGIAVDPESSSPWTSASSAKHWLDKVGASGSKPWFTRNRANLYLVAAAVLLFAVIAGWGSHPAANAPANSRARRSQAPPLSLGEKVLVELGLAVPPDVPLYKGNPEVKVWEDERTALYYCPGSDLYGKTERGKFSTQRDAQLDQFEPAFRRACE
jgi:hypothetical protein